MRMKECADLPKEARDCKARIRQGSAEKPREGCGNCGSDELSVQQYRTRWFLVVISSIVWPFRGVLCCWRCKGCGKCMTHYPSCCVPFKRYLRGQIEGRGWRYVTEPHTSYERAALDQGMAVSYEAEVARAESSEADKEHESTEQLAGSTVWRWVSTVGAMAGKQPETIRAAQHKKGRTLSDWIIASWKYRSERRREILTATRLWLEALRLLKETNEFAMGGSAF